MCIWYFYYKLEFILWRHNVILFDISFSGMNSFCAVEGHIFGQMGNRPKGTPDYPDYQLLIFNAAQDEDFIENGLDFNLKREVSL